jgi:hypothetical protein
LGEAAPAEEIEVEEAEHGARGELLAELVIAEARSGDAVEEHLAEHQRQQLTMCHRAVMSEPADGFAELADEGAEDQRGIVGYVGWIAIGRELSLHRLGDFVKGVREEPFGMLRADILVLPVADEAPRPEIGILEQPVPLFFDDRLDQLGLALGQRFPQRIPGQRVEFESIAHRRLLEALLRLAERGMYSSSVAQLPRNAAIERGNGLTRR